MTAGAPPGGADTPAPDQGTEPTSSAIGGGRFAGRRARPPAWVLGAALTAGIWTGLHLGLHWFDQLDLRVYRMGARALLDGSGLYLAHDPTTGLPFTYPPFAAGLMIPLAALPWSASGLVVGVITCVALARICHLGVTRIGGVPGLGVQQSFWIVLAVASVSEPVQSTLWFGQVNMVLTWLVLEDLTRAPWRWAGVGTGIATAVKLVPGVFLVHLWLAGARRSAVRGAVAFAAASATAALLFWPDSRTYWSGMFLDAGHVGGIAYQGNQSILGAAARALHTEAPPAWGMLLGVACLVGALVLATRFARRGDAPRGLVLTAVGGLLASPISWSHHWVWWIPLACLLLGDVGARRPGARILLACTVVVFTIRPLWWPPGADDGALRLSSCQQLAAASYVLLGLAILAWHARLLMTLRDDSVS